MKQTLQRIRETLFLEGNSQETLNLIEPLTPQLESLEPYQRYCIIDLKAIAHQKLGQYTQAAESFLANNDFYQAGYSHLLAGDLNEADVLWHHVVQKRPNHWCLGLRGLITGELNAIPTFLQIRNHTEGDLYNLFIAKQDKWAHSFISFVDFLCDINMEAYKFIGRALFYSGNVDASAAYFFKGQQALPNDSEIYYHLGEYYNALDNPKEAMLMLKQCILINPDYVPASELLKSLAAKH